ncbi:hypothetical protein Aperf_G00000126803 [Anoplocephala perfoliata]
MPRQLLARGRLKITTNERISIVPQTSENVFQLLFNPIINEDGGEYRCVFNHKTGVKYKVVVVNIQVQPKVDIDPKGEVEVLEGEYAFVVCNASGTPFPQFRWWMLPLSAYQSHYAQQRLEYSAESQVTVMFPAQNAQQFKAFSSNLPQLQSGNYLSLIPVHELASKYKQNIFLRSGKLIINAVNRDMTGWYFCEAHNSVKPSAIEHILLSVHYVPQVFLPQREVFFAPYGKASLVCEFLAFPFAEVEWLLDGRLLDTSPCGHRGYPSTTWCTGGFIFEPFGYEDRRPKQKHAVPSAVVAPHLTPSANIMASHESEFPSTFSGASGVANSEKFTHFLLCVAATITVYLLFQ